MSGGLGHHLAGGHLASAYSLTHPDSYAYHTEHYESLPDGEEHAGVPLSDVYHPNLYHHQAGLELAGLAGHYGGHLGLLGGHLGGLYAGYNGHYGGLGAAASPYGLYGLGGLGHLGLAGHYGGHLGHLGAGHFGYGFGHGLHNHLPTAATASLK